MLCIHVNNNDDNNNDNINNNKINTNDHLGDNEKAIFVLCGCNSPTKKTNIVLRFEDTRDSEGSIIFLLFIRENIDRFIDESKIVIHFIYNLWRFSPVTFFFRSVFPSFGAAAAAVDSAINPRDETIIFPIVVLRNYSSLRSRPDVRCLQVSCRFHRDFRNAIKFIGKKRRAFHYVDRQDTEWVSLSFASTFTLERAKISIISTFCN